MKVAVIRKAEVVKTVDVQTEVETITTNDNIKIFPDCVSITDESDKYIIAYGGAGDSYNAEFNKTTHCVFIMEVAG